MLKIHPRYLNNSHLLALWRESLQGQRRMAAGGSWHDFTDLENPLTGVGAYLSFIASEGLGRGLKMNHELIFKPNFASELLTVTTQELMAEKQKLQLKADTPLQSNPVYKIIN